MDVFAIILPLLLPALLGYLAAARNWLSKNSINHLNKLTFTVAIPLFLFTSMATAQFGDALSVGFFLSFYLPVALTWLLSTSLYFVGHYHNQANSGINATSAGIFALGASYSNTIIVGLPVLLTLYGNKASAPVFLLITFHSAMLFTLTTVISALDEIKSGKAEAGRLLNVALKNIFINPLTVSLALGLMINFSGLGLPSALSNIVPLIGKPIITLALVVLGASLYFYKLTSGFANVLLAVLIKLAIVPAVGLLFAKQIFDLSPFLTSVIVILLASPTGVNAYLIACSQQSEQNTVANTVVISTLLAAISIPIWLMLLS